MNIEQQYIDVFEQARNMICQHSSDVMNAVRDAAFEDFKRLGFPTKKVERYKYTDIPSLFAPDYGLNLNRFKIPVDPYEAFKCDVPNLSTLLYFMVNDAFYNGPQGSENVVAKERRKLPEGVFIGSMQEFFSHLTSNDPRSTFHVPSLYGKIAKTGDDGVTAAGSGRTIGICAKECQDGPCGAGYQRPEVAAGS